MRIIHFEDSIEKYMDISRELRNMGIRDVTWVTNVCEGLEQIEAARKEGRPFDFAITDMRYPIRRGQAEDPEAGEHLIQILAEKGIDLPVIVCSTGNYCIPGAYECIWYSKLSDWEIELRKLLADR